MGVAKDHAATDAVKAAVAIGKNKIVKLDSNGELVLADSANAWGVTECAVAAGGVVAVHTMNAFVKVVAGAAVLPGQPLKSDASGDAVPATPGDYVIGKAKTAAALGQEFEMLLLHMKI